MIMVEALVQQLAAARVPVSPAGPAPSDLREKLVQTDHTELNQVNTHTHTVYIPIFVCGHPLMVQGHCVNGLFVFCVDNNAQRPVPGGPETDW